MTPGRGKQTTGDSTEQLCGWQRGKGREEETTLDFKGLRYEMSRKRKFIEKER